MTFWLLNLLNGLSLAMILFLISAGLTLIFGLMRVVNMAHGSFFLLGAYIGAAIISATGSFVGGLAVAMAAMAALGILIQRVCLGRLYKQELPQALLTLGVLFMLADMMFWIWGGDPVLAPQPRILQGTIFLWVVRYPIYRLFLIGFGLAVALALWALLERTRIGAVIRAGMDDEEMVRGIGINMPGIFAMVFALGAALAAAGGVLGGPLLGAFPGEDFDVALLAFAVVTIGGLGSVAGAFLGSLLIGMVDNFGTAWFPQLSMFTIFVPMLAVLALRPRGLLGRA